MKKLYVFNMISLDGYFEGLNNDISWHHTDEEFNEFAIAQTGSNSALIFGRKTYELMASYWPTEAATNDDPTVANIMNSIPKIVISKSLDKAEWNNTTLVKDDIAEKIQELKEGDGKDIAIFGSSELCVTLLELGLIDELRIMVNPVLIGNGTPLFQGLKKTVELKLTNTRGFKNGNVLHTYDVVK